MQPWSGPVLGGTVVTLSGARVADADALVCTVGSSVVWASAHSSGDVRCATPTAAGTGWSTLTLSSHGTILRSAGTFYAHASLWVSAAVPPAGPVAGGTRVAVLGTWLRESATMRCRFEASGTTSAARVVSAGQAELSLIHI